MGARRGQRGPEERRVLHVKAQKVARGWVNLRVAGVRDLQRVRKGSFAIGRVAVPAYESIVLDTSGSKPVAFRVIVNARTGAILARQSLVDYFSTAKTGAEAGSRGRDLQLQRHGARHRRRL